MATYKEKFNKRYGQAKGESNSLADIARKTGRSLSGLRQIYKKGVGAYRTNPGSVRPTVTSPQQWAMARVYSAVMGGKAAKVDKKELSADKGMVSPRNYKKEYQKFQSSGKMKKYRAKLNKYNRDKGTYGNGDNLDASHAGGAIVGFEASSKNKGRAEKSRLKGSSRNFNEGGLWANIRAKRARGEKMRKKGAKGAPTPEAFEKAKAKKGMIVIGISLKKKGKKGARMNKKDCGCKH